MNRGGSRGGRGARGGSSNTYSREQLSSLGVANNEAIPSPVLQPPPLYPILERKPVPLTISSETDYYLILKQDIIDHMQLSTSYTNSSFNSAKTAEQPTIDRLVSQMPTSNSEKYDWCLFPAELRPKLTAAKRMLAKRTSSAKSVNVTATLDKLESIEAMTAIEDKADVDVREKDGDDDDIDDKGDDNVEEPEDIDDEMDNGTDYANNYFDNGEGYEEDDDNLDDGPVY